MQCSKGYLRHYIQSVFEEVSVDVIVDRCIRCSGPGAMLNLASQEAYCVCKIGANSAHFNDLGVCECNPGHILSSDGSQEWFSDKSFG